LNFGKAIEAAKAGKSGKSRMERSRNVRIHSSCITISCYYRRCKRILESFVPYRAYWALKLLSRRQQPGLLLEAILSLKTGQY
jgi:hypothetical protein